MLLFCLTTCMFIIILFRSHCGPEARCHRLVRRQGAMGNPPKNTKAYRDKLKATRERKAAARASHKNMQFSKKVRVPRGHSSLAGTQSIDSIWGRLQKGIPDTVHSKKGHSENPLITEYTWSSLFRLNNAHTDAACTLGAEALAAKKSSR